MQNDKCTHCHRCPKGCDPCAHCGACSRCGMHAMPTVNPPVFVPYPVPYPVPAPRHPDLGPIITWGERSTALAGEGWVVFAGNDPNAAACAGGLPWTNAHGVTFTNGAALS